MPVGQSLTPEQRSQRARIAAHTLHSRVDSRVHTAPARKAFLDRFEKQVDPDGVLPDAERRRRAESAKAAYFTRLAYKSAVARSGQKCRQPESAAHEGTEIKVGVSCSATA
jgi:hypothetical protein